MSDNSKIEWTNATWNCVTGCEKVSPGCDHCYAETFAERWRGVAGHHFEQGFDVRLWPDRLEVPLDWKKPRLIFTNSMSDLYHKDVPDDFIARVFAVMAVARRHTFQVLTKRHARQRALLRSEVFKLAVARHVTEMTTRRWQLGLGLDWGTWRTDDGETLRTPPWPLPNVWCGVSVEDQHWADLRIPALLETPASVRFVSAEPLLGPLNLTPWLPVPKGVFCETHWSWMCGGDINGGKCRQERLSWIIAGGESGPGARPMELDWVRALVWHCRATRVPLFVKQLGKVLGREVGAGAKGGDWNAWPEDLRIREFPVAAKAAA